MMRRILAGLVAAILVTAPALAADCSGTITTGGTAQTVFASGNVRALMLMNNSANLMCVSFSGNPATIAGTNCGAGSYALPPGSATTAGGSFTNPANITISSLSVITATTGDRFSCERQ